MQALRVPEVFVLSRNVKVCNEISHELNRGIFPGQARLALWRIAEIRAGRQGCIPILIAKAYTNCPVQTGPTVSTPNQPYQYLSAIPGTGVPSDELD